MDVFKPEIAELLSAVATKYAKGLQTTTDFEEFSLHLSRQLDESISASTLKRLWGYVNDKHKPRTHTLNLLSKYVDFDNFSDYCDYLKKSDLYNSSFFSTERLSTGDLRPGVQVEIGWSPNRYLRLRYHGNMQFEVVEAKESKLQAGDRFESTSFLKGQPLSLACVIRQGKETAPFIGGRNGGLTLLNCLVND